eukprot:CAMPEP_0117431820 /NCGR_PEP_ID=MMETSP0758-20121206/11362_1 /TAXON_ID=63605 /ORGANISM="Percolomonas cosmopolitus, Strain AE-1 (ATCC 50343)" /LENGTH=35 /DNA_ID= /DNA_START= /DNA_END= /DNA_ORIENTATION=
MTQHIDLDEEVTTALSSDDSDISEDEFSSDDEDDW